MRVRSRARARGGRSAHERGCGWKGKVYRTAMQGPQPAQNACAKPHARTYALSEAAVARLHPRWAGRQDTFRETSNLEGFHALTSPSESDEDSTRNRQGRGRDRVQGPVFGYPKRPPSMNVTTRKLRSSTPHAHRSPFTSAYPAPASADECPQMV